MRAVSGLLMMVVLAVGLGGCISPDPAAHHLRPPGFTIGALVRGPESSGQASGSPMAGGTAAARAAVPRALRPARYLVETDLALRFATGPVLETPVAAYPPMVRTLTPRQMDRLWLLAREAGLFDPGHPGRQAGFAPPARDPSHATAVFEVSTDHRPHVVVVRLDDASAEAAGARQLLDRLAELAWLPE